jgi:hypothetical protein
MDASLIQLEGLETNKNAVATVSEWAGSAGGGGGSKGNGLSRGQSTDGAGQSTKEET